MFNPNTLSTKEGIRLLTSLIHCPPRQFLLRSSFHLPSPSHKPWFIHFSQADRWIESLSVFTESRFELLNQNCFQKHVCFARVLFLLCPSLMRHAMWPAGKVSAPRTGDSSARAARAPCQSVCQQAALTGNRHTCQITTQQTRSAEGAMAHHNMTRWYVLRCIRSDRRSAVQVWLRLVLRTVMTEDCLFRIRVWAPRFTHSLMRAGVSKLEQLQPKPVWIIQTMLHS